MKSAKNSNYINWLSVSAGIFLAGCSGTNYGEYGLQADGSYRLTQQQKSSDCGQIRGKMKKLANETVIADAKTRQEVVSSVALGVLFGVGAVATYRIAADAGKAGDQAKENRARMNSYNGVLKKRGCSTWNYEAHIDRKHAELTRAHVEKRRKDQARRR